MRCLVCDGDTYEICPDREWCTHCGTLCRTDGGGPERVEPREVRVQPVLYAAALLGWSLAMVGWAAFWAARGGAP